VVQRGERRALCDVGLNFGGRIRRARIQPHLGGEKINRITEDTGVDKDILQKTPKEVDI